MKKIFFAAVALGKTIQVQQLEKRKYQKKSGHKVPHPSVPYKCAAYEFNYDCYANYITKDQ